LNRFGTGGVELGRNLTHDLRPTFGPASLGVLFVFKPQTFGLFMKNETIPVWVSRPRKQARSGGYCRFFGQERKKKRKNQNRGKKNEKKNKEREKEKEKNALCVRAKTRKKRPGAHKPIGTEFECQRKHRRRGVV